MKVIMSKWDFDKRFPFQIHKLVLKKEDNLVDEFHWHNFFEITYIQTGSATYFVNEKMMDVTQGDLIIFNNAEAHGWEIHGSGMEVIVMAFSIDLISERVGNFDYDYLQPFIERGSNFQNKIEHEMIKVKDIEHLMKDSYKEWYNKEEGYPLMIKANVLKILTILVRHYTDSTKSNQLLSDKRAAMKRLENAFLYMYQNYEEKITLNDAANLCCMSPNYFSSYFKKVTSCTFSDYLTGIRIRQAQKLFRSTDMSAIDIAIECGFKNMSNFYRLYKKHTGLKPGDERG